MRKLSNCNKKKLLDNPGKIVISNLRSNPLTQTWKLSIMSAISFLPSDLAWSAGVCKGYQNECQKHSLILSFEMSHPNTKEEFIIPLHHTLSHQKNLPSLSV
jgi:hypothetical protein